MLHPHKEGPLYEGRKKATTWWTAILPSFKQQASKMYYSLVFTRKQWRMSLYTTYVPNTQHLPIPHSTQSEHVHTISIWPTVHALLNTPCATRNSYRCHTILHSVDGLQNGLTQGLSWVTGSWRGVLSITDRTTSLTFWRYSTISSSSGHLKAPPIL